MRLAVWVVVAGLLCAGQAVWLVFGGGRYGFAAGEALAGVMVGLLWTTPAGAIRLPRGWSEGVILVGTAVLQGCAGSRGVLAGIVLAAGVGMLVVARGTGKSAWWAAPVAWNPAWAVLAIHAAR